MNSIEANHLYQEKSKETQLVIGTYSPSIAQREYLKRRKNCKRKQLLSNKAIHDKVQELLLQHQWSPEEISN
ncbi:MAG: hypothetical protein AB9836_06870 [Aminipila sp.]